NPKSQITNQQSQIKKPAPYLRSGLPCNYSRQRPTLPHTCACSTIGGGRLNFRVRNGNGGDPAPMATRKLSRQPAFSRFAKQRAWGPTAWNAAISHASSRDGSSQTISMSE